MRPASSDQALNQSSDEGSGLAETKARLDPSPPGKFSARWQRRVWGARAYWGCLTGLVLGLLATLWLGAHQEPHPDMQRQVANWDLLRPAWWAYPLERNAFKRRVLRGRLNDVFLLPDASQAWAVGGGGLILHSPDGGKTWQQQRPSPPAPPPSAPGLSWLPSAQAAESSYANAAAPKRSQNNAALVAPPAPSRVPVLAPQNPNADLQRVVFVDALRGFAAGADGLLLATLDGGVSWQLQNSPTREPLIGLYALDERRIGVATDSGLWWVSADAGATWASLELNSGVFWDLGSDASGKQLFAASSNGLLRSQDGGQSWASMLLPPELAPFGVDYQRVRISADGRQAWLLISHSGGQSELLHWHEGVWKKVPTTVPAGSQALGIAGESLLVADAFGGVARSPDGGQQWQAVMAGADAHLRAIAMRDSAQGWAIAASGQVLHTSDGGASWQVAQPGRRAIAAAHLHSDGRQAWALTDEKDGLLYSQDGGVSWVPRDLELSAFFTNHERALYFSRDAKRGLASGSSKDSNNVQRGLSFSRDGGLTWQGLESRFVLGPLAIALGELSGAVWGAGTDTISQQPSMGAELTQTPLPGPAHELKALILSADEQSLWAVGAAGRIVASGDGGQSWHAQRSGVTQDLLAVSALDDGRHVWAVGAAGTVLRSADGGAQWQQTAHYARYWSPAVYALLVLGGCMLVGLLTAVQIGVPGVAAGPQTPSGGTQSRLASDHPVLHLRDDKLNFKPAVEALSSFIRNAGTQPRVTLAVSGEWGSGKSSLMRMLQNELNQARFSTTWFNAWHQQQEGQAMSALFNAIRLQAVPRFTKRPLAALRVRSRLIWGRGAGYRGVALALAFGIALLLGDLLGDGLGVAVTRIGANFKHHVLLEQQVQVGRVSLAKLDPFASLEQAKEQGRSLADIRRDCADPEQRAVAAPLLRVPAFCALALRLTPPATWRDPSAQTCAVKRAAAAAAPACRFDSAAQLLATLEADVKMRLTPLEAQQLRAQLEVLPAPPLLRWLETSLLGGVAGFVLLLFTKGMSVYGLQLLSPLRNLLGQAGKSAEGKAGKEAGGTVERYRAEFALLCDALDGRLVVFIDDLDRCNPETVNAMLELSNYLVDVGRCFVVLGAALERVKRCVRSPVPSDDHALYADDFLRKLIHVELPVPQRRQALAALVTAAPGADRQGVWLKRARPALLAAVLVGALLGGLWLGSYFNRGLQAEPLALDSLVTVSLATVTPNGSGSAATKGPATPAVVAGAASAAGAYVGLDGAASAHWQGPVGLTLGLLLLGLLGQQLQRHRDQLAQQLRLALGGALRVQDSGRFMDALGLWLPLVAALEATPRQLKRFHNRARLLAVHDRALVRDEQDSDEAHIVALSATHQLDASFIPAWLQAGGDETAWAQLFDVRPELQQTWSTHRSDFGALPSPALLARFLTVVQDIKLR